MANPADDTFSAPLTGKDTFEGLDPKQLEIGAKVELEHTDDLATARQIAADHLRENANYYFAHAEMEKKLDSGDYDKPSGQKGETLSKAAVGWFVKGGQLVTVIPEEGQSAGDAIKEEATDAGVEVSSVVKGEAPDDWKTVWEGDSKDEKPKAEKPKGNPSPVPPPAPKPAPSDTEGPPSSAQGAPANPPMKSPAKTEWLDSASALLGSTRRSKDAGG